MTENTKVLSIRLNNEDKDYLAKYITRESLEHILQQIKRGDISITSKGIEIKRVNTQEQTVNTTIAGVSEKNTAIDSVDTLSKSVNTPDCENCEFAFNALDMSGFDEVCEFKGIDKQKALDKCVQMLWR